MIIWTSVVFILHVSLRWKIAVSVGPPPLASKAETNTKKRRAAQPKRDLDHFTPLLYDARKLCIIPTSPVSIEPVLKNVFACPGDKCHYL